MTDIVGRLRGDHSRRVPHEVLYLMDDAAIVIERLQSALSEIISAMERDGDPAFAHIIMDAKKALNNV